MTTPPPPGSAFEALNRVRRPDRTKLLAALASRFGDLDLAEDVLQEAFEAAMESWPRTGTPREPLAWLMTTATRRAIDRLRREKALAERLARVHVEEQRRVDAASATGRPSGTSEIPDERLELFFACCHPTLKIEEQVVLTLRYLGGLGTREIATAFLVPVPTMQQRLVRAKRRIRDTRIPVRVPPAEQLPQRLPAVLRIVYLIYSEGYAAATGDRHIRTELTVEAIRLARILLRLRPGDGEVAGLLALFLLTESRAEARVDPDGLPVALEDQDRRLWDPELIAEGCALAERSAASPGAGGYAIQAAIAAVHAEATEIGDTDWAQIVVLYDMLVAVEPGPMVRLGRAVAVGRRDGEEQGLEQLRELDEELRTQHAFHSAVATTLEKLGRLEDARIAWESAFRLATNDAESRYFEKRWRRVV